ncbi:UDP-N-acetyl glucosamine 2-epimerase [Prevotella corporis]|uniref:UDP-N-acetyl glucosamine 2-epimerase n=1 Tax=Prevotella corporis TaxID=28128 RepID=UPI0023F03130|nr:UDP-N-acetyl glucosamine 2-epimerase [Prevotella corporis]
MSDKSRNLRFCIFCGARPNFIKVAPIVRLLEKMQAEGSSACQVSYSMVYAGKSDDITLEDSLFENLQISRPDVCLDVVCENLNDLTGQVMSKFELYLQEHPADVVIVVDDLASTMAAAIVTKKQAITLAHIAAGTRSFDITMPKEINRLVIDGLSDVLFTAGLSNNSIANKEGAELSKVYMVGNILIDNIRYNRERMGGMSFDSISTLKGLNLKAKQYYVFTLNRKALMSDKENLEKMLDAMMQNVGNMPVIAPLRASAIEAISTMAVTKHPDLHIVEPLGYLDFAYLLANARGIITDSGNVAEEATFNNVPCATLNSYTEHIETVKQGTNVLVGENADKLGNAVADMTNDAWKPANIPDRWDGRSAERIVQTLIGSME